MTKLVHLRLAALLACVPLLLACASNPGVDTDALYEAEIANLRSPEGPTLLSSGQPSYAQLQVMADAGVRHVVNLRTPQEEVDFDEQAAVEALGMRYYSIPVAGAAGINRDNAASLASVIEAADGEAVLVHCATGNRVGGLMAVQAHARGSSVEAAVAEGERWGLTSERLQGAVSDNLRGSR